MDDVSAIADQKYLAGVFVSSDFVNCFIVSSQPRSLLGITLALKRTLLPPAPSADTTGIRHAAYIQHRDRDCT